MPDSKTPQDLSPELKQFRQELRAHPKFQALVKSIPRERCRPYRPSKMPRDEQTDYYIYQSGRIAGQQQVVVWFLGFDPYEGE